MTHVETIAAMIAEAREAGRTVEPVYAEMFIGLAGLMDGPAPAVDTATPVLPPHVMDAPPNFMDAPPVADAHIDPVANVASHDMVGH